MFNSAAQQRLANSKLRFCHGFEMPVTALITYFAGYYYSKNQYMALTVKTRYLTLTFISHMTTATVPEKDQSVRQVMGHFFKQRRLFFANHTNDFR